MSSSSCNFVFSLFKFSLFECFTYYFTKKIILDTVLENMLEKSWKSYQNWSTVWHINFFLHETQFCSSVCVLTINITWYHQSSTTCLIKCSELYLFSYSISTYAVQRKYNSLLFKSSEYQIPMSTCFLSNILSRSINYVTWVCSCQGLSSWHFKCHLFRQLL